VCVLFLVIMKDTFFNEPDKVKTKLRVICDQVETGHRRERLSKDIFHS
jgi:hypothetical protein